MAESTPDAPRRWRLVLLVQPPLLLAYLFAVRADLAAPSFVPVIAVTLVPVLAGALAIRSRAWWLVGVALLEIAWGVLAAAMVGFAIAWRIG